MSSDSHTSIAWPLVSALLLGLVHTAAYFGWEGDDLHRYRVTPG